MRWPEQLPGVTEDRLRREFEKFGTIRSAVVRGRLAMAESYLYFLESS